ncbi:hypothetical protein [Desulfonema magnum]|uniref:Single Cache domain-containing protein n=1 Tax=Desulfonema magnum TaxID=45655 RepID=A0A975GNP3_9BACT|nr:hypothetical protein [Desulfonema magnum]QTA87989.1 Single Cache domain-containing protein [Desulfonema magnum]
MIRFSRIWKLYLIFTIVLIVSMTIGGFILEAQLKRKLEAYLQQEVLVLARIISDILPNTENPSVLDVFCKKYGEMANVRITIIKNNGKVIGESDRNFIRTDNHLKRPEVRLAFKSRIGTAVRFSDTLNKNMLYVALLSNKKEKVIRIAILMTKVKEIENGIMIFLGLAIYLIPVLAIVVSFFFARFMTFGGEGLFKNSKVQSE